MRSLLAILAITLVPVGAVLFWTRSHPDLPSTTFEPRSVVWADRVFTSPAELRRWLRARGERYEVWARTHPFQAARLEHRRAPRVAPAKVAKPSQASAAKAAKPAKPSQARTPAKRPASDSGRPGWVVSLAEILAALLAVGATATVAFRAGRRVRLPRVRPPAMHLDLRPLVDGLGSAAARLTQVRPPNVPSLRRSRAEAPTALAEPRRNGHRDGDRMLPVGEPATAVADVPSAPRAALPVPAALIETLAVEEETWELCTTAVWRGYVSARFYARPAGGHDALAESESFDWWAWEDEPRNPQVAQQTLAELRARLEAQGWEPIGRGRAWYEIRFRRHPRPEW